MELTTEQYNELPDVAKPAFAEVDGKYIPAKDAVLKGTLDELSNKYSASQVEIEAFKSAQATQQTEIEAAKVAAREEAITEAAKKGNWEEQEKLLREKFEDELKRTVEATRGEVTKELSTKQAAVLLDSDIKSFAKLNGKDEGATRALEILMAQSCKLNENGEREYFGNDGSALSLTDFDAFSKEFAGFGMVGELVKGESKTTGGGLLTGSKGKSSAITNAAADKAAKSGDLVGFFQSSFK